MRECKEERRDCQKEGRGGEENLLRYIKLLSVVSLVFIIIIIIIRAEDERLANGGKTSLLPLQILPGSK